MSAGRSDFGAQLLDLTGHAVALVVHAVDAVDEHLALGARLLLRVGEAEAVQRQQHLHQLLRDDVDLLGRLGQTVAQKLVRCETLPPITKKKRKKHGPFAKSFS